MKHHRIAAPSFAFLLLLPAIARGSEEDSIKDAFNAYKAAIVGGRAAEAAEFLSASTVRLYRHMSDLALYADRDELRKQPTTILMEVLNLRLNVPAQDLQQMSDHDLVVYAVTNGFVGGKGAEQFKLEILAVNGAAAIGSLGLDAGKPFITLQFFKEDGAWRVDWRAAMYGSTPLDIIAPGDEAARETLVLELLPSPGGHRAGPSIWLPPLQRP